MIILKTRREAAKKSKLLFLLKKTVDFHIFSVKNADFSAPAAPQNLKIFDFSAGIFEHFGYF